MISRPSPTILRVNSIDGIDNKFVVLIRFNTHQKYDVSSDNSVLSHSKFKYFNLMC